MINILLFCDIQGSWSQYGEYAVFDITSCEDWSQFIVTGNVSHVIKWIKVIKKMEQSDFSSQLSSLTMLVLQCIQ